MRSVGLRSNLAGPPVRYSTGVMGAKVRRDYDGFIKVRLAHSQGRSYLVPEVLIGVAGGRYFLPSFFGPPWLQFNIEPGVHSTLLSIDVGPPRAVDAARLEVTFGSRDHVLSYGDGAELYRCSFRGPQKIARFATGVCRVLPHGDFALQVFHHTKPDAATKIRASGELWSSPWNLRGTRQVVNVAYTYFTSLPAIVSEHDLHRIAMASDGTLLLQTTSGRSCEEVLELQVYRSSTRNRTTPVPFDLPCRFVAPPHLYLHMPAGGDPAYYEVVGPEILRVGLKPGATLPFSGRDICPRPSDLKRFDYVILGDTSTVAGLAAPYDEEQTTQVTHLERLDDGLDLFQFWLANQNTDQVSGRVFEPKLVKAR